MTSEDQIRNALASYAQRHDDQDAEAVVALFTEDARFVARSRVHEGREAIRAFIANVHNRDGTGKQIKHMLGGSVIQVDGDSAEATTDFMTIECMPATPWAVKVAGRYRTTLRREDGEWRFALMQIDCDMFFRSTFGDPA